MFVLKRPILLFLISLYLAAPCLAADTYYRINPACTESGTGANWRCHESGGEAMNDFPRLGSPNETYLSADRSGGNVTYYVAGGTLATMPLRIDTALSGAPGTNRIIIKKANAVDNGEEDYWEATMATTQSVLDGGGIGIRIGYVTIDGVTGSGNTGHGIRIKTDYGENGIFTSTSDPSTNISVSHVEISGDSMLCDGAGDSGFYLMAGADTWTIENCYIHRVRTPFLTRTAANITINACYIGPHLGNAAKHDLGNTYDPSCVHSSTVCDGHSETFSAQGDTNITVSNSTIIDWEGSGMYSTVGPAAALTNINFFNNVLELTQTAYTFTGLGCADEVGYPFTTVGGGILFNFDYDTDTTANIYSNTFINVASAGHTTGPHKHDAGTTTTINVKNNLFYCSIAACDDVTPSGAGAADIDSDYNYYWGNEHAAVPATEANSKAPVSDETPINMATGALLNNGNTALNTGVALGSPYNADKNGVSRPQGAGWDMGAYEVAGSGVITLDAGPVLLLNAGAAVTLQ